jgi:hypothetical protein
MVAVDCDPLAVLEDPCGVAGPTTAGILYSRAMIGGWDRMPPPSVTRAPMDGNITDHAGER